MSQDRITLDGKVVIEETHTFEKRINLDIYQIQSCIDCLTIEERRLVRDFIHVLTNGRLDDFLFYGEDKPKKQTDRINRSDAILFKC